MDHCIRAERDAFKAHIGQLSERAQDGLLYAVTGWCQRRLWARADHHHLKTSRLEQLESARRLGG